MFLYLLSLLQNISALAEHMMPPLCMSVRMPPPFKLVFGISAYIRIGQEILCLPYAGLKKNLLSCFNLGLGVSPQFVMLYL